MYTATEFTPIPALIGGLMIGLSALMMLAFNGRIAGISGIVGNLFHSQGHDRLWRVVFVIGMLGGAALYGLLGEPGLTLHLEAGLPLMLLAGFIVGLGTRLARGCTSGHGVCGIGRVSPRSIAATAIFMAVAGITVFVTRHLLGA